MKIASKTLQDVRREQMRRELVHKLPALRKAFWKRKQDNDLYLAERG